MKPFKFRDKHVELLKKELKKIHARSTLLYIRRSVRKANKSLNEVVDFIERYDSDLLAVKSVKCKNIYLARALQNEKERSNRLLQEKIEIQSAYHDALREKAEIKKENWNLEQMVVSDLEDFKNMLPNLVEFSDHYSRIIMKYDDLRKKISAKKSNDPLLPRSLPNISFGNNSNQPVSTVNPMVKGCVIQKPTINVRRVPFPNETRSSMFEYLNINSPILEEREQNNSPANTLTRRCENGLRNVLNISNRRRARRPEPSAAAAAAAAVETNYCDSTADDSQVNVRLEPVVRLEDVTRLLQHSSIRISETPSASPVSQNIRSRETTNEDWSPEVILTKISTPVRPSVDTSANALEGCSWMYQRPSINVHNQPTTNQNDSIYQSRIELTPRFIPPRSLDNADELRESTCNTDRAQSQSVRSRSEFFQLDRSPLTRDRPANVSRDPRRLNPSRSLEILQESEFCPENLEVVSSLNVDNEDDGSLTIGVTRRKRRKAIPARLSNSSEIDENVSRSSDDSNEGRRSLRPRRSISVTRNGAYSETSLVENKTVSKRSTRKRKSNEDTGTRNTTLEDSVLAGAKSPPSRRVKLTSIRTLSDSIVSNSDLDNSSRQSRSTRNRSNVSYKDPSLRAKLRRG